MPIGDIVANSDIAKRPIFYGGENMNTEKCNCKPEIGYPYCPVPPVPPFPPYPVPVPPPFYPPCPIPPIDPEPDPEKGSISQQICKLSRKANVITKMLENLEQKKKDVIINIGGVSYNFGNIDLDLGEGWPDGSYAATVKKMLEYELGLIKAKIAELAEDLGDEVDTTALGIEGTVGGN